MKKILLVEDDMVVRETTAELLELSDYKVVTAANGKLGIIEAKKCLPDIVICDIMMPEVDGYGVLKALSEDLNTKFIPFIFLTAKTEHKEIRKGMDLGADDYLTKPFEEEDLLHAIESRLAKTAILAEYRNSNSDGEGSENEVRNLNELKNFFDDNGTEFLRSHGETIYNQGDHSNYVYLIIKGVAKTFRMDESGKELITGLYKSDDFFGYSSFTQNLPYQESATALEVSELVGLHKDVLKSVLEKNHQVTLELIDLLTDDVSDFKNQLLNMAYGSVRKKTANTILQFAEKLNKKPDEPIRISRNDLASVAGIATESLIRTLSGFKKDGLIDIEGRTIKILDLEGLKLMD